MSVKGPSGEASSGSERQAFGPWREVIFAIESQRTRLNYVVMLEGQQNL